MQDPVDTVSYMVVDVFRTVANPDRLRILMVLQSGRFPVSSLSRFIYSDTTSSHSTQISRMLAPMRRLALVKQTRLSKFVFYELTDLGREILRVTDFINSLKLIKRDSNGTP